MQTRLARLARSSSLGHSCRKMLPYPCATVLTVMQRSLRRQAMIFLTKQSLGVLQCVLRL
jgi:hypothetical protein